jgi:integrase
MPSDGFLYQRKPGSKCYFVYYTGEKDEKGKYIREWFDLDTTDKAVAEEQIKLKRADLVNFGKLYAPSKQLFKEWLYFWLDEVKKPELEPKTYEDYEYIIRIHIVPDLGLYQMRHLSSDIILKYYNKKRNEKRLSKKSDKNGNRILSNENLSLRTLQKIQYIMNASLVTARKMRKIPENPIDFLDESTRANYKAPESTYLESTEVLEFLNLIAFDQWFSAFVSDLGSGLRLGELCGLKWKKVDLNRGTFDIRETRQIIKIFPQDQQPTEEQQQQTFDAEKQVNGQETEKQQEVNTIEKEKVKKTKIINGTPKSEKSNRFVPLPIDVVDALKKWKKQQKEELFKIGLKQTDDTFVFTWEDGRPIRPDYLSKHFKKLIRKFGRSDLTFHKLRHSYATMLLELGEEMKTIQENLGHAQLSTTSNIYAHVLEKLKIRAASKLNGFSKKRANL